MKGKLLIVTLLFYYTTIAQTPITDGIDWSVTNLTSNNHLEDPNTIIYGPDGSLWITERTGKKVVKVSTTGGSKTTMLDLSSMVHQSVTQDGLMGMTVHPDLYADINTLTNNYVYLVYTYDDDPGAGVDKKLRIARYTYNSGTGNLNSGSATTILDNINAGEDHISGKIVIGPDLKLYWTIGDFGKNRGNARACYEIRAQYLPTSSSDYSDYQGKILRLNLDGTIPADNPTLNGVQSHVYSYGHRNAQGLVFGSNGKLYSSEHGDKTDDELNIIESGKNYGWPLIAGYNDDSGYGYCNWSNYPGTGPGTCDSYDSNSCPGPYLSESTSGASIIDFAPPIGTYNTTIPTEPTGGWLTWPTVAPASIDIYESGKIPGWGKSLFIPTLKAGKILRTKLNAAGDGLEDGTYEEFHSSNDRYRDIAFDPDGVTLYTITDDRSGVDNPGVVMKIQYSGTVLSNQPQTKYDFALIPNPTKNNTTIRYNFNQYTSVDLVIHDIHGRTIEHIKKINSNYNLNTTNLSNGLYFVKLKNENEEIATKKLIIQ